MITNNKKAPTKRAFKRPGEPIQIPSIVSGGPDGRVVRTVSLPNTRGEIQAGKLQEGVSLPKGSIVVLNVGYGNRMDWFTAGIVGKALAPCSYIQLQGEDLGPSFSDAHYLYGLEEVLRGIRAVAAEEAEYLRDWEVIA